MLSKTSEIRAELLQILESRWLRESTQLRNLLRHVVEETLAGRDEGLKEYALGREVFNRAPDYDPRNDAIVRVQASLLRKRLTSYYENEGRESRLRIELPRGGYHPVFLEREPEDTPAESPAEVQPGRPAKSFTWKWFVAGLAPGVFVALIATAFFWLGGNKPPVHSKAVWGSFVETGDETIVSFGVPLFFNSSSLYIRDTRVNLPGNETKGKLGQIERALDEPMRIQEDVYTGIGDLVGTHEITRWLEARGVRVKMANSHYLGHSEIASKNLVVVSSCRFQTLLKEMDLPNRFRFNESAGEGGFFLSDPLPGEQNYYQPLSGAGVDTSYAVMSLWPGKQPHHRILQISGITTWATQGAAQYAVDPARLAALQAKLDADPEKGPRGEKGPFVQVLLRVEGKYNQARTAEYVTHRYLGALHLP